MKIRFIKNGAAYGFGYLKGATADLDEKKNADKIKAALEAGVIEVIAKKPSQTRQTRNNK